LEVIAGWPAACTFCLQYVAWCILWTLAGTVILLIRVGVIQVNIGGTAALFFGGPSTGTFIYTASIVLTAVQLALMVRRPPAFPMRARIRRPLVQTWLPALPSFYRARSPESSQESCSESACEIVKTTWVRLLQSMGAETSWLASAGSAK